MFKFFKGVSQLVSLNKTLTSLTDKLEKHIEKQEKFIDRLEHGKAMTARTFLTRLRKMLIDCQGTTCFECKQVSMCENVTFFTQLLESDIDDLFTLLERMEANVSSTAVHDVS